MRPDRIGMDPLGRQKVLYGFQEIGAHENSVMYGSDRRVQEPRAPDFLESSIGEVNEAVRSKIVTSGQKNVAK